MSEGWQFVDGEWQDPDRHLIVRFPGTTKVVVFEHRRMPWGGTTYSDFLCREAREWCIERNIPEPKVSVSLEVPGSLEVKFEDKDHALEFKLRWYGL